MAAISLANRVPHYDIIIFDIVGVLVRPSGVQQMIAWSHDSISEQSLWERWFKSKAVYKFERGLISPLEFAHLLVDEFNLNVSPNIFLNSFKNWASEIYPGVINILGHLSVSFKLGVLSNTNVLHWNKLCENNAFLNLFDFKLPSHETGYLKPDKSAFDYLVSFTGYSSDRILFFDDNSTNINVATSLKIKSYQVSGIESLRSKLTQLGFLG